MVSLRTSVEAFGCREEVGGTEVNGRFHPLRARANTRRRLYLGAVLDAEVVPKPPGIPAAGGTLVDFGVTDFSDRANGWAVLRETPSSEPDHASLQTTVVLAMRDGGSTWEVVDPRLHN